MAYQTYRETNSPTYRTPGKMTRGEWRKFALILGGVLAGFAVLAAVMWWNTNRVADNMDTRITSCEITGRSGTVGFTITNTGSTPETVTVELEYRDGGGARVDTDSWTGHVPAGDTVRAEESTILDAAADSGSCAVVGIR